MRKQFWAWLLVVCLMLGVIPISATATETTEDYLLLTDTDDYTVYTTTAYPWTVDESGVYTTNNTVSEEQTISSLKVVFKNDGVVSFDWTISGKTTDYFSYGIRAEDYSERSEFTSNPLTGEQFGAETSLNVAAGDVLYVALFRYKDTSTGTATVSNLTLSPIYDGDDVVVEDHIVFDETMGSVAVKRMDQQSNFDNTTYYTLSSVDESAVEVGQSYRLTATASTGNQFYGWVREYIVNGVKKYEFMPVKYSTLTTQTGDNDIFYNTEKRAATPELQVTLDENSAYRAVFAPTDTYVLRVNANFYTEDAVAEAGGLAAIINSASTGTVVEVLEDMTLEEDATVSKGVLLYVPFRSGWSEDDAAGQYRDGGYSGDNATTAINNTDHYATLTVEANLTVNGSLAVGSVISYNSQRFQGHISGSHGRIVNNDNITVNSGGTMTCYGLVEGTGTVHVEDGGVLKEMFIIGDFAGGSNTAELFFTDQMPFKRFSMQRVQCTLTMEAQSKLMAMMHIWASSMYNEAEVALFGTDSAAAFYPTSVESDTLALTRTYDPDMALADGNGLLDVTGIGRTEWTFSNGLKFQPLTVSVAGITVDTGNSDFTIPYNFKIRLVKGEYDIPLGMRIMPGAEVVVESGASVNIGGRLMVMDGLVQTDMSGDRYPTRDELVNAGFSGSGELTVNGTLTMQNGSTLGGVIKNNGTGKLVIGTNVYLNNSGTLSKLDQSVEIRNQSYDLYSSEGGVSVSENGTNVVHNWVQQDGAKGEYDENTTWFNLPARIYMNGELQKVEAGKTYLASALSETETASYEVEYLYVEDGVYKKLSTGKYGYNTSSGVREMTAATETVTRTVNGAWVDSEASEDTVEVTETTVAGMSGATVDCTATKSGTGTVLSNLKVLDENGEAKTEKYVFLVKYTTEGSTVATTVTANDDGSYTIPSTANGVTIESCLLGDIDNDGEMTGFDVIYLRKAINGTYSPEELGMLATDIDSDGEKTGFDVIYLRKAINGTYTIS